jgi:hypothetical protein
LTQREIERFCKLVGQSKCNIASGSKRPPIVILIKLFGRSSLVITSADLEGERKNKRMQLDKIAHNTLDESEINTGTADTSKVKVLQGATA